MPYTVRLLPAVRRQIASWGLGDLLVDVYLRLENDLSQSPAAILLRLEQPFDGMVHVFSLVDPDNRMREHHFYFHVVYGQDEQALWVPRGAYVRREGG